ncbi:DUF4145 domain-containing protein [Pseudomonas proteolytica]|uniref:DUF4145 domain-containing protein n=1 Tax=Pseudomonas proteolytica TaxID=219574 RepID=UPI0014760B07|nr:DUF4145 domain-containing protein [Pseudomonas proteolytica]NMY95629.1 DUF4145 domain-containing protein [Pseudomonas proteolytica]
MADAFRAHCPRCDGVRNCIIHGAFDQPWHVEDGRNFMEGQTDHKLVQCAGCETVFYYKSSWDSEDCDYESHPVTGVPISAYPKTIETYPIPEKKSHKPDWIWSIGQIDPQLYRILDETYKAREINSFILASVGLRTAFDRVTEFLKVDVNLTLEQKVSALLASGFIGETEANTLRVVTDAGSAAAHRGWAPDEKAFKVLIATLEQFIYRVVVTGKAALDLTGVIPPRPTSPKKKPKPAP